MYQHERIQGVNVCVVVIYLYQWLCVLVISCGFVHCSCCSISDDARRSGDRDIDETTIVLQVQYSGKRRVFPLVLQYEESTTVQYQVEHNMI